MNSLTLQNNSNLISGRNATAYYCSKDGLLTQAKPYEVRPKFTYNSTTQTWDNNGILYEDTMYNNVNNTYDNFYKYTNNYSQPASSWTMTTAQDIGPTGQTETLYKITVPQNTTTTEWKIPVCVGLQRQPAGSLSPCWSFFIKGINIPSGTMLSLGVPGQSLQPFDMYNLNWTPSVLSTMQKTPSSWWNLYAGREVYANGWVRIGVGGRCVAGNVTYSAAFYSKYSSSGQFYTMSTPSISFYMCRFSGTYETKLNTMSSFIDMASTRVSDLITTPSYYTNSNNTITTYVGSDGSLVIAPPYTARPNYTYSNSTWTQSGYISETATSAYDTSITTNYNPTSGMTVAKQSTVLDPTKNDYCYTLTSTTSSESITSGNSFNLTGPTVFSIFVKANTSAMQIKLSWSTVNSRIFDLDSGSWTDTASTTANSSGDISPIVLSNGWYRIALGIVASGTGKCSLQLLSAGTVYVFGPNITYEQTANTVSSYMPPFPGKRGSDNIVQIASSTYSASK